MIVIDEDNGYVALQGLSNRSPLTKIERRRRDSLVLPVQFLKGGRTRELATGSAGVIGIKELGAFSGGFFAVDHEWHQEGSGQNAIYYFIADLNSSEIEAKFTSDAVKEIKLAVELRWFENNRPFSTTNDIELVVKNRYIQGTEDPVVSANDSHATQAQAEAGLITSVWMSPLRVFQGITAFLTSQASAVRTTLGLVPGTDIIPMAQKAAANGVASLDGTGKVPAAQLPDAVLGVLKYQGGWDPATNDPDITVAPETGWYYLITSSADDTYDPDGAGRSFEPGDWLVYNGGAWDKVDNTEPVASTILAGIARIATTAEANQKRAENLILTPARLRSQSTANLSANLTLTSSSDERQILAPQTSDRTVTLPAIAAVPAGDQVGYGHPFSIIHDGAANSLLINNSAGVLQVRVDPGESAYLCATSSGWLAVKTFRAGVVSVIYPGVDFTAAPGNVTLYTPVAGLIFHPVSALIRNDSVGGVISTPAQCRLDDGADGDDITSSLTLTSPAVNRFFPFVLAAQPWVCSSSAPLRLRRTVAAAGTSPIHTGTVIVNGVLL